MLYSFWYHRSRSQSKFDWNFCESLCGTERLSRVFLIKAVLSPSNVSFRMLILVFSIGFFLPESMSLSSFFVKCDKAKKKTETLILSINMILVICIPEAKQIGRQVLFIRRIYSKWTFFLLRFVALFNVSYFIWCGHCYVKFVFLFFLSPHSFLLTRSKKEKGIPLVYNIPFVHFSIQSNKINQKCLEIPSSLSRTQRNGQQLRHRIAYEP